MFSESVNFSERSKPIFGEKESFLKTADYERCKPCFLDKTFDFSKITKLFFSFLKYLITFSYVCKEIWKELVQKRKPVIFRDGINHTQSFELYQSN